LAFIDVCFDKLDRFIDYCWVWPCISKQQDASLFWRLPIIFIPCKFSWLVFTKVAYYEESVVVRFKSNLLLMIFWFNII